MMLIRFRFFLYRGHLLFRGDKAPWCKTVVGGAVLTQEYADKIGADKYAKDAMEAVRYAQEYYNS